MPKKILNEIYDQTTDVLALINADSLVIVECNKNFEEYFSISREQAIGKTVYEISRSEVPHEKVQEISQRLNLLGLYNDNRLVGKNQFFYNRIDYSGKQYAIVRVCNKDKDLILEQYRTLLEKNVAGVFQGYLDGNIITCNLSFARMLGFDSAEELLGANAYSFYPSPEDRDRFLAALKERPILSNYELRLKKIDGNIITCLENTYLERDSSGREIITGTIIDVTQQKEAENAHLESEERFRTLSRVTLEGVVFLDGMIIVDSNDQFARIFGHKSGKEVLKRPITDFIALLDFRRIKSGIEVSSSNSTEVRATTYDGKPLFLDVTGSKVNLGGNDLTVLVLNDYTLRKRAENTLEQTIVRLRNLLENSPNAVIILTDDKVKYANFSALNILGAGEEDELYDEDFGQFISASFREEVLEDLRSIREGEEIDYKEIKIVNKEGFEVDAGIKSTLTVYENKPSVQISLNNISARVQLVQEQMRIRIIEEINAVLKKEIEEHKVTQQKLIKQQNYTRNLIESSLDMILASDENECITEFNHAAQQHFGYNLEEVIGKNTEMLYHDLRETQLLRKTLAKKGEYTGEVHNVKKNGQVFTSLISASLIKDDKGKVIGSMGVSRDITVVRENERKALEHRAKLESIFNSTENLMIWTMDMDHRITTHNTNFDNWASHSLGEKIKVGTMISKVMEDHIDEDLYQGQLLDSFTNAFRGRPQQFEYALKDIHGKTIWLQAFLNPVYLGEKLEEISCLVYDITERKSIDRRILEALKEKEVLLQEIHHRVKNNLQVISSILNLQSSYVNDKKTLEILQESQNRIRSMSFIHETLYRTSDFSSIDFSEYIRTLSNNLIQSYRLNDCQVTFEPILNHISMHIDQAIPCGLIVNELISNALKYAFTGRKRGKLILELTSNGQNVMIRIADDGVGLPEHFLYEKTDSLGVQLVYTLIEQLDGTIQVNTGKEGTEFLITFEMRADR